MPDKVFARADNERARMQEVAAGEFAPEMYVRDAWSAAVALGRAYILGTGRLQLTVAGNARVLITNPAGSGVLSTIVAIGGLASATAWATTTRNPTVGLPTTNPGQLLRMNAQAGVAPVTQVLADTNTTTALGGGTAGPTLGIPGGSRVALQLGLVLAPGESLGLNDAFAGAADFAGSVYVVEEAL